MTAGKKSLGKRLRDAIYQTRIAPGLFEGVKSTRTPTLRVIVAEPGAGASLIRVALMKSNNHRNGAVILVKQMIQRFHPDASAMDASHVGECGADTERWIADGLADAKTARVNVIMEALPTETRSLLPVLKAFKEEGFGVEVHALSVPLEDCWRGLRHRDAYVRRSTRRAASTSSREFLEREYAAMPGAVQRLENSGVDRVVVYRRDGRVVYENQVSGGAMQFSPVADKAITLERERELTTDELQARVVELSSLHGLISVRGGAAAGETDAAAEELESARGALRLALEPKKALPKAASIEASFRAGEAIARRFGGPDASLIEPIPGKRTKGPILGETREHVIQGTKTSKGTVYIAHLKRDLERVPKVGLTVTIQYSRGRAGVKGEAGGKGTEETFIESSSGPNRVR